MAYQKPYKICVFPYFFLLALSASVSKMSHCCMVLSILVHLFQKYLILMAKLFFMKPDTAPFSVSIKYRTLFELLFSYFVKGIKIAPFTQQSIAFFSLYGRFVLFCHCLFCHLFPRRWTHPHHREIFLVPPLYFLSVCLLQ